jgi:hypothetical protein
MATISAEDDAALTGRDLTDFDDSEFALMARSSNLKSPILPL